MKQDEQKIAVATSTLTKPVVTDQTAGCPECQATCIVRRGPLQHCNACGHEWGTVRQPATGQRDGLFK